MSVSLLIIHSATPVRHHLHLTPGHAPALRWAKPHYNSTKSYEPEYEAPNPLIL
ncbi:hypothetical protein M433DRAFT_9324 [Acidomyces richmondensis BFW]|nr:hypothetical protein M433DRAFT_10081 [Acidomyces richmondensis BFW]KYG40066.1 hypothetical protein M433DRAFT_9324 [Acidomyces richmondensis BFW]